MRGDAGTSCNLGGDTGSGDMQEDEGEAVTGLEDIRVEEFIAEARGPEGSRSGQVEGVKKELRSSRRATPAVGAIYVTGGVRRSRRLNVVIEGNGIGADEDVLQKAMRMTAARNLDGPVRKLAFGSNSRVQLPEISVAATPGTSCAVSFDSLSDDNIFRCLNSVGVFMCDHDSRIAESINLLRGMESERRSRGMGLDRVSKDGLSSVGEEEEEEAFDEAEGVGQFSDGDCGDDEVDVDLDTRLCDLMDFVMASKSGRMGRKIINKGRK